MDQVSFNRYSKLGWLVESVNAEGFREFYAYDAKGQVAKTWKVQTDVLGEKRESTKLFAYDRLGRQVRTGDVNRVMSYTQHTTTTGVSVDAIQTTYDAFGEQTGNGLNVPNGQPLQETAAYGANGRLWKTNQGGVTKVYRHDLQGHVTAELVVPGTTVEIRVGRVKGGVPIDVLGSGGLLMATLFRLSLNIAATRLILAAPRWTPPASSMSQVAGVEYSQASADARPSLAPRTPALQLKLVLMDGESVFGRRSGYWSA